MIVSFVLYFVFLFLTRNVSNSFPSFEHSLELEKDNYRINWMTTQKGITIEMVVRTRGWIALGFSENGAMKGGDIILGWISEEEKEGDENGNLQLHDTHALGNEVPKRDKIQNIEILSGYQNESHTVLTFYRDWDTCDEIHDIKLGPDTIRLIWAYHDQDPSDPSDLNSILYHGSRRRGVRSVYLKEKPLKSLPTTNVETWDLVGVERRLPSDDHTHYWCQIFKAPSLDKKHHMIGFKPLIQKGHESYVHHMVLYECHVADSSASWFENHVGKEGEACYSPNMPPEWTYCLATNAWAWAVGSEGEVLPDHVGMPLGENFGGATYFMLETHYDNPEMVRDIVDRSGVRIYYTDLLREHDTGMILVGTEVNFLHLIPPRQEEFTTLGRCTSQCTQTGVRDKKGIKIINGVLHSHLASRRMKLRHFRKGVELPVILKDDNYDFNFQASRIPESETTILPGDELFLECVYNTKNRTKPTFGGLSTREEMCIAFILYYPRQPLADCRSLPDLNTVMNALGIKSIYGEAFQKLAEFMKDLGSGNDAKLQDLLMTLLKETGSSLVKNGLNKRSPISEEEILNQPFYTVQRNDENHPSNSFDLKQIDNKNYRTLMSELLLSIKIESPIELKNKTVGDHFANMNWVEPEIWSPVMRTLYYGDHSSLCLAHGRKPLIKYESKSFPKLFNSTRRSEDNINQCGGRSQTSLTNQYLSLGLPSSSSSSSSFIHISNYLFVIILLVESLIL